MQYRVSMPAPHGHLFHVEVTIDAPGEELALAMPVWTPGSYLVREFARHVEGWSAHDGHGAPLATERLDKHRFRVATRGAARAVVSYRVFAHELSVRTCHLDGTHGFFNGAALLVHAAGRQREPHTLEIDAPRGWRVACALPPAPGAADPLADGAPADGPWRFTARDYDELVDSPVEVGPHQVVTFDALGRRHGLVVWGRTTSDLSRLVTDVRRVVEHLGAMMGGLPYERYLFLLHLTAGARGGLEHAASTTLHVKRTGFHPREAYQDTLALVAHEFFHVWNVKGLRPAALVPYDYGAEQYTKLLWWFEGVTSYYDELTLVRAGLADPKRYLKHLGEQLTALARVPGARKVSVEEASLTAWVKLYRPDENSANSTVSYYLKGEVVALALDLLLRRSGSSLDDLVRSLYQRYRVGGLPEDAVEAAVGERVGTDAARAFFDRNVRGTGEPEIDLGLVGLASRRRRAQGFDDKGGSPPKPDAGATPGWLGLTLDGGSKLTVKNVREGSPAWRAGVYAGDEIVAESRFRVDRGALWDRLTERGPGGILHLTVFRQDELVDVDVPLGDPTEDTVWLEPVPSPSPEQRNAYEAWLSTPAR